MMAKPMNTLEFRYLMIHYNMLYKYGLCTRDLGGIFIFIVF